MKLAMKHRVVRTAVLDTNVAKGTSLRVLGELQRRGWRLQLSDIALIELAYHLPEDAETLIPRLAKLAQVLDPDERIAPTHAVLIDKLGGRVDGLVVPSAGQYRAWKRSRGATLDGWTSATTIDDLDTGALASLKTLVDEGESDYVDTLAAARRIASEGVDDVVALMRRTANSLHLPIRIALGVQERFHLHFSLLGLHGARAALFEQLAKRGREPRLDPNSTHDTNIAQHLAEGVFVVTDDLRFIADDVDATGSFQAPWVRTPWEMLIGELPGGPPWGRSAKRARDRHTARTIEVLKEIEGRSRASLLT